MAAAADDKACSKLRSLFSKLYFRIFLIASIVIAIVVPVVCWETLIRPKHHSSHALGPSHNKPNIVVILTDDQDLHMDSLSYMPLLNQHITQHGTLFQRHYCTVSICCPSRVTLWTGQHAHNHGVTDVVGHWGGWPRFKQRGLNSKYLPIWLQSSGYNTYYAGKLFNALGTDNYKDPYPAGWTASDFLLDPYTYQYLNPAFQRNAPDPDTGKMVHYDPVIPAEGVSVYSTTMVHDKGYGFLEDAFKAYQKDGTPFFLTIAPIAPHADNGNPHGRFIAPIPETQADLDKFQDVQVPRVDWFNPDKPTGVSWTYSLEKLDDGNVTYLDTFYRARLAALQSVDRMVANITTVIGNMGIANNTYIIYTTDNGYHVGQHRLQPGKNCPFETDVNIPLIIRGPGVPKNVTSAAVSSHTDIAPTIFDMIGRKLDPSFDGKPIQYKNGSAPNAQGNMPKNADHVNVEFWGDWRPEGEIGQNKTTAAMVNFTKMGQSATYKALRVVGAGYDLYYSTWCSSLSPTGIEHEMYDMTQDPYQMSNLLRHPNGALLNIDSAYLSNLTVTSSGVTNSVPNLWKRLDALMFVLKTCKGDTCRNPWNALLPKKNVLTLEDALRYNESFFDEMRAHGDTVGFQLTGTGNDCIEGPILSTADGLKMWKGELPVFQGANSLFTRDGVSWEEWT